MQGPVGGVSEERQRGEKVWVLGDDSGNWADKKQHRLGAQPHLQSRD